MKKILSVFFISISLLTYSQSFQLTDTIGGNLYNDGETLSSIITEADLNDSGEFSIAITVNNLTGAELNMHTLRTNVTLIDEMSAYVCFGVCLDSSVLAIDYEMFWEYEIYSLHLIPNGKFGLCQFKLEFWTEENQADKITLNVEMDMQNLGVTKNTIPNLSLSAYPNPSFVNSTINVAYTLADKSYSNKLVIKNILGTTVMTIPLNPYENLIAIDTSPLVSGVYFYAIENGNQISSAKKLIVN